MSERPPISPRSPRAALEPEQVPPPPKRSERARNPFIVVGNAIITHEAIGVCGLITPWNWPINQIVSKVAPALAAGCTMLLKPSEIAPISGLIFAEVMHAAGDTVYGLAAYVQSGDLSHARAIARKVRAGQVHMNYPELGQSHHWRRPFGMTS